MLKQLMRPALVTAVALNLSLSSYSLAYADAPNPDDVPGLSTLSSSFEDFSQISDYAKNQLCVWNYWVYLPTKSTFPPNIQPTKHLPDNCWGH